MRAQVKSQNHTLLVSFPVMRFISTKVQTSILLADGVEPQLVCTSKLQHGVLPARTHVWVGA